MTKLLDQAIAKVRELPEEEQERAAESLMVFAELAKVSTVLGRQFLGTGALLCAHTDIFAYIGLAGLSACAQTSRAIAVHALYGQVLVG